MKGRPLAFVSGAAGALGRAFAADLTIPESRQRLYGAMAGYRFALGINVPGVDSAGPFGEQRPADLTKVVRLNVESTLETIRALLNLRDPDYPFRLINVASLAAFYPIPAKATYAASKTFVLQLTMALNEELRDIGRPVVVPGLVNRVMLAASRVIPQQILAWMLGRRWSKARDRRTQTSSPLAGYEQIA